MSVYIQEVLGLLKRNKKKTTLELEDVSILLVDANFPNSK